MPGSKDTGGFTLIEILVVLIVVGLLAALAIVNIGGSSQQRELENEVRELYLLMQTASDRAVLDNRELGLVLNEEGYQFVVLDEQAGRWGSSEERMFRPRSFPEWLVATRQIDGDLPRLSNREDRLRPEVVFFSSGETTPFELEFTVGSDTSYRHRLVSEGFGKIDWQRPGSTGDGE